MQPRVEVITPRRGGLERTTNQPGTIRAFDFAPLYAKVSGYLETLNVDRGTRVKAGELLLKIFAPELDAAVAHGKAQLEHSHAAVAQATERVRAAEAKARAAEARQNKAVADLETARATRVYRAKQLDRISDLVVRKAVEPRLRDEQEDEYHAALANEHGAEAGIETARAEVIEAHALIKTAEADLVAARADVKVSEAILAKAQVFVDYTKLTSPYDGVVIFRGEAVHPGAFIQSAVQGLGDPLLTVARDDKMRTIVPIPDRDVPYCNVGDPAIITLDALAGRTFDGKVSRMSESEDIRDRTMRIEVDLANPDHLLRDGMFGRAEIILEKATKAFTVPSPCLTERDSTGAGMVLVVRDGTIHRVKVRVGRDDGLRAEITSGLDEHDQVVLQPDVSLADGTKVQVKESAPAPLTPKNDDKRPSSQ
jgi:RND family efflux transporter MFP subunit